ncbi:eukaryotic translation initiation factor 4 gamma 1-like [Pollicipes pollicipes]|uniref:eukaryotic translation initiation factor 4 gamma 1-like n=1 Tax=Pollicipes pollicipes TaxID=41117 RepID=UPI001884CC83|nr:eukaryotic translation initiation factor 4 gamma 1-like [Pollicipes pollicipes]
MQQQAGPGPGPRRIEISLNRDVKLRETENAWKATYKASPGDLDDESRVIRAFKGILNKITPNNIERLTGEIKKLELNTESRLHKMISTLFEKAVDEPMYADQYALLCVSMSKTEVESAEKDGKVNFRKLLLTQCQREFEKDKSSELNRDERLKEIAEEKDEEVKKEKMRSLEKESTKMRLRSNGNIRFIGELYKLGMLTDRIMHQCIVKLVRDEHEDSYECLCKLMTTIGQKLEKAEAARGKDLSSMFNGFNKVIQEKKFSSRIRFMLQDLIDMRKNGWVNTRTAGVAKPMTIEEVHKQARQQAVEQQVALAQAEDRRRNDRGSDRDRRRGGGRDGQRGSSGGPSADGWSTVNRGRFDASRVMNAISSGANQVESNQVKLGPGGGSSWSFGSKVTGGRRGGPAAGPGAGDVRTTPNMFSMLPEDGGSGAPPPMRLGPPGRRLGPPAAPAAPAAPAGPRLNGPATMDGEKMRGTVRLICEEYIDSKDFPTSLLDVEEKLHTDTMSQFVTECLNFYVDARSTEQRHMTGDLHRRLLESGHLTAEAYLAGAQELLEVASDLAPDIPSMWANLGELLAPPLTAGRPAVSLAALAAPAAALVADKCGGRLLVALLKRLVSLHGADKVRAMVPANFDWSCFFGSDDHVKPLLNAQLGFLVSGANVQLSVEKAPPGRGVRSLLSRVQGEPDFELWVKRNVGEEDRASAQFIKDVVCALCFDAIVIDNGAEKVQLSRLEKHGPLLKCLIVSVELELAALYGVLALVRHLQFPPNVLDQCFRQLYDMDVISEPAFLRWREGNDPAEQEGMGVALMSVKAFFKALEEDAAGDDDERT